MIDRWSRSDNRLPLSVPIEPSRISPLETRGLPGVDYVPFRLYANWDNDARAERKVDRELLDDIKRVTGKQNLLFEVADATLEKPDGTVPVSRPVPSFSNHSTTPSEIAVRDVVIWPCERWRWPTVPVEVTAETA